MIFPARVSGGAILTLLHASLLSNSMAGLAESEKPSQLKWCFTSEKHCGKVVGQFYSNFLMHPKEAAVTFSSQFSTDPLSFP